MTIRSPDSLLGLVQSLQQVIQKADASRTTSSVDALRLEAMAVGFDPEMAEEVYVRVKKRFELQRHRELIEKTISQEEIAEAVVGLLLEGSLRRLALWAKARAVIRDSGGQLGTVMEDLLAVVDRTGFGLRPNLNDASQELSAWLRQAGRANADARLAAAAQAGELAPWQAQLLAAWLRSAPGRAGRLPDLDDLADLMADAENLRVLEDAEGPWDALSKQAAWLRAHRQVGAAFDALHAAA